MDIRAITSNVRAHARSGGIFGCSSFLANLVADRWFEWRLDVDTRGPASLPGMGVTNPDAVDYFPIPYLSLYPRLRNAARSAPAKGSFLDYGAGRGRVVSLAATLPFERVIGVEISGTLVAAAQENLRRLRRVRCATVEVHHQDAAVFDVPDDVGIVHFFKPFRGTTLRSVLAKIHESHRRRPRPITIIFFNDQEFREVVTTQPWLRRVEGGVTQRHTPWPIEWGVYHSEVGSFNPAQRAPGR